MIGATQEFKEALDSKTRNLNIIVEIKRNNSDAFPIDLTQRVKSVRAQQDDDSRNGRITIRFDNYDFLLSPLNRDSTMNQSAGVYDPLFDSEHEIYYYEGIETDNGLEYIRKFTGVLGDDIDADSSPGEVTISARDRSKWMQDAYIYQSKTYKFFLVEEVIQDLLDYFLPEKNIKLEVQNPTQYMIGRPDSPYTAKDIRLWQACQMLADAASHELRFTEDGRLILRKIKLDFKNDPVNLTLNQSNLISDQMQLTDANVRNHIVVKIQGFDPIIKESQDSIDKYGFRYMEVHRSMSDIITDVSQAHELATTILRELSFAQPRESAGLPLHPLLQIGDIVSINNSRLGTNEQDDVFKIVGYSETYTAKQKRTSLQLQGHDNFIAESSVKPKVPTNFREGPKLMRILSNYPRSGWDGAEKKVVYPKLMWNPPTEDVDGNPLEDDFGGYVVFRRRANDSKWNSIASVRSYIPSLELTVNYFYDYSLPNDGSTYEYKIHAVNKHGDKSGASNVVTIKGYEDIVSDTIFERLS